MQFVDGLINIVLTFGFGHDIAILKMAIIDKVDYIDIEPVLPLTNLCAASLYLLLFIMIDFIVFRSSGSIVK